MRSSKLGRQPCGTMRNSTLSGCDMSRVIHHESLCCLALALTVCCPLGFSSPTTWIGKVEMYEGGDELGLDVLNTRDEATETALPS